MGGELYTSIILSEIFILLLRNALYAKRQQN